MRRLLGSDKGSVSVYLIVILVPIFFFNAVLIDFVRVKLAVRETDHAVQAGLRSLLSEYDLSLRPYGLFGRSADRDQMKDTFEAVMQKNFSGSGDSGGFRYVDTRLQQDTSTVNDLYTLANHRIFKGQILEDMKYRAPVEYGIELAGKFKNSGVARTGESASIFYEHSEELERKRERLNDALDEAWTASLVLYHASLAAHEKYSRKLTEIHDLAELIGLNTISDVRESLIQIDTEIRKTNEQLTQLTRSLQQAELSFAQAAAVIKDNAQLLQQMYESVRTLQTAVFQSESGLRDLYSRKNDLAGLLDHLLQYASVTQLAKIELNADAESLSLLYEQVDIKVTKAREANEELRKEKERFLTQLGKAGENGLDAQLLQGLTILDDSFFSTYKTENAKLPALFNGFRNQWTDTIMFTGQSYSSLVSTNEEIKNQANKWKSAQEGREDQRKEQAGNLKGKLDEQRKLTQGSLNDLQKALGGCGIFTEDEYTASYQELKGSPEQEGLYPKYNRINSLDGGENGEVSQPSDTDGSIKTAMSLIKKIGGLLNDFKEEMYVDEYALTRFSYRSSSVNPGTGGKLAGQESEYILYGLNSCSANYSAAYGEMYLLVMALRTTEALTKPQNEALIIGSPLLVFLAAAAQGAAEAVSDMNKLVRGEEIPIMKKLNRLTMNYKDLLRLFLLIHSNDKKMMARMQALIELNTGSDLARETTYLQASASASIRLWFLPRIMTSLKTAGLPVGSVQEGRREIRRTAVMSY